MWAMNQILFSSFDKRLAGYLLDESIRTHSATLHTTHEQIARNLGSAREVVSRMLKYFEKEGIVSLSRGTVTITDEKKLKSCIYGEKRCKCQQKDGESRWIFSWYITALRLSDLRKRILALQSTGHHLIAYTAVIQFHL